MFYLHNVENQEINTSFFTFFFPTSCSSDCFIDYWSALLWLVTFVFCSEIQWNIFSSVQFSRSVVSDSLRPHELQHARPPCPSPTPGVHPNSCASSRIANPTISLSSPSRPAPNPSQHQGLFQWVSSSHQMVKVLEFQLQHQSFQRLFRTDLLYDGLVWSPCSPRDSQKSSPTPQFKSINSSVLNFLYSPTLTSTLDYWKNHSFD